MKIKDPFNQRGTEAGEVQRAICILGVHRSGTSVVARAINLLGAYLGEEEDFLPSGPDNAEGFWERKDIVDLHDRILSAYSRLWHTVLPLPKQWEDSEKTKPFRDELLKLIDRNFSGSQLWAWKDPRTSVLLPLWKGVFDDLGIQLSCVYVVRNPLEVARSLQKEHSLPYDKFLGLWFYYNITALQTSLTIPNVYVLYDNFLNNWETELRRCANQLGVDWLEDDLHLKEKMAELIRPDLRHGVSSIGDLKNSHSPYPVIELYELLVKVAEGVSMPNTQFKDSVDRLSREFMSYSCFFTSDCIQSGELTQEITNKTHQITNLQEELNRIRKSFGWELLNQCERLRLYFFPPQSKRGGFYDFIIKNIKVLIREGYLSLLYKTKIQIYEKYLPNKMDHIIRQATYKLWISQNDPGKDQLKKMKNESFSWLYRPKISIITPVYNPSKYALTQCIKSVLNQTYDRWELCLVNGGSDKAHVKKIIETFLNKDQRIKCITLPNNQGIAANSNEALKLATGEYVGFLDHDDMLAPFALYEAVKLLNQDPAVDFIYSDEDKITARGNKRYYPFFKPTWSPDTLLSVNYMSHFAVIRRAIVEQTGGFREGYDGAQDYDLILRIMQKTTKIKRIPKILYHWRASQKSVASNADAKPQAYPAAKKAIMEYLTNRCLEAEILDGIVPATHRVKYYVRPSQKVSIIIPTKDKAHLLERCVTSILLKTDYKNYEIFIVDNQSTELKTQNFLTTLRNDGKIKILRYDKPFNFSAINNFAVRFSNSDHLLFLNNDTEVISSEWLSVMLEFSQRKDIGAVGAKLYYPDDTIQHAGVIIGLGGLANHSHRHYLRSDHGYMGRINIVQNLSAVTAGCMMIRKEVFDKVGGFDERLTHNFNDVDLCLKIREKGYLIIYTPYAELYHHESVSRGKDDTAVQRGRTAKEIEFMQTKWKHVLELGDPYYNPNLTLDKEDFSIRRI